MVKKFLLLGAFACLTTNMNALTPAEKPSLEYIDDCIGHRAVDPAPVFTTRGGLSGSGSDAVFLSDTDVRHSMSRWQLGGDVGFTFNGDYSGFGISPQAGYFINSYLVAGGGVSYSYYSWNGLNLSENFLGGNVFIQAYILDLITVRLQPEVHGYWYRQNGIKSSISSAPALLAGIGLSLPTSPANYVNVMLSYDILQHADSPYGPRLVYSVGYGFRF